MDTVLWLALAFMTSTTHAQQAHATGPQNMRVELDNPSVTVVRIRLAPHEKTPAHDVTPRVVVWLTDAHLRDTFTDGITRDENHVAGEVNWVPAQRHIGENRSDAPIEFIAVIPKTTQRGRHQ
jgi:quercetin dioxygenase-like cupin family protein